MTDEWLTYLQAGERLGISPEAARQRAIRGAWPRRMSNDGMALIRLPDGIAGKITSRRTPKQTVVEQPIRRPDDQVKIAGLETEIRMLREMLAEMRGDRDHWRLTADRLIEQAAIKATPAAAVTDIMARLRERQTAKSA